jgi:hypothetical protein
VTNRVGITLTYQGKRTLRGRVGFTLMRFGAWLASKPVEVRRVQH